MVLRNREKVGNVEMLISRSGKSGKSWEFNTLQLLKQNSGTMQRTEMADHSLESEIHKKYKNTGLVFLG